jgi:hypothetical protein
MTTPLSDEQRQALQEQGATPLRVLDAETNTLYVLLRADLYERVKPLFEEDDFDVSEMYPLMDEVARQEGWDDPDMDVYNELDPRRQP